MKKYFLFIVTILLTLSVMAQSIKPEARLKQLKKEVSENLTQNLLPYWSTNMVDNLNGGFYGRIDSKNKVYPDAEKGGILNARILWTYSAAYRVCKDTSYLRLATRAKDYILAHFIDPEFGGAYMSVNSKGEPVDTRKQVYTQSFFIYGLSEYYRITKDEEALNAAKKIFELFEEHALDKEFNGYYEVFTRNWQRSHDLLIGESTIADEKTMNTHLHLMEAYTNLYRAWPDKRIKERVQNMVEIFLDKIIDSKTSHQICFMDRSWNRTSPVDSYGHDIECSWLLYESATVLGDKDLIKRVKEVSLKIADASAEGLQADGSLLYEKNTTTGEMPKMRSWWVQVENVVGNLNAYELSGDEKYLDKAINCWNYTNKYLVDHVNGGWYSGVSETGVPGRGEKGGFWTCPYHNGRMCMEVIERVK